jgi:hypothetical protein
MRIRSLLPLAVAVALGGALVSTPANAAQTVTVKPETFAGGAASRALDLSILGQKLTLGDTVANIVKGVGDTGNTTFLAKAIGTGEIALLAPDTTASSAVTSEGSQNVPAKCGLTLPDPIKAILDVGLACGSSSASLNKDGLMNAVATGTVGDVELSVNTLLSTLGVAEPVGQLVNTLNGVLQQVTGQVDATLNVDTSDLLTSVLNSVVKTKTLSVKIGDAKSEVVNTVNTVTAKAHSAAVDIKILPNPVFGQLPNGQDNVLSTPLLEIIIGEANAAATYDRLTGKPVGDPTFDPAIVRVKGLVPTLLLHADPDKGIAVALGQDLTLLAGTPLESRIALGAGKIVDDGVFGKKAVADGVAVELLKGISGGIVLNLAHAEAGAIDNLAQTKVLDTPALDIARGTPTSLPRTGAETALPLALAAVAVAIVAVRRARLVATTK